MMILVCNAGSTSLKFKLYDMPDATPLCEGKVERVGSAGDALFQYKNPAKGFELKLEKQDIPDYKTGISRFLDELLHPEHGVLAEITQLERVGFKTVLSRGYYGVHALTEAVLQGMEEYMVVAPVHNTAYLQAIRQFRQLLPNTLLVGAFETAFHTTIPEHRRIYSVPYEWHREHGLQKMGYHGASHSYIADKIAQLEGPGRKVISCHLGGSCSLCAIDDGKSVDNSFGFSLQAGVLHSARNGDIDPFILPFMVDRGLSLEQAAGELASNGGLKGISGISGDIRYIEEEAEKGNARAKLALEVFVYDIVRYLGAYYAELGGLDDLVFTAGIGENDDIIRRMVCGAVGHFGIRLDEAKNKAAIRQSEAVCISAGDSKVKVWVIPANEELGVAMRTWQYQPEVGR